MFTAYLAQAKSAADYARRPAPSATAQPAVGLETLVEGGAVLGWSGKIGRSPGSAAYRQLRTEGQRPAAATSARRPPRYRRTGAGSPGDVPEPPDRQRHGEHD